MAGYIEWAKGLPNKPEVVLMATVLKRDRYEVAGRLMGKLWEWSDENIPEENINKESGDAVIGLSPSRGDNISFIDEIVGIPGFALAMEKAGWLKLKKAAIVLPGYGRNNGSTAKTRARNARNQAKRRAGNVTDQSPSGGDKKVTTQPNPTQPCIRKAGRMVGGSLEGVQGEGADRIQFACLGRVQTAWLRDAAALCALHRAAHAEQPAAIPADEATLLNILAAGERSAREGGLKRFRGIVSKRAWGVADGDERRAAAERLDRHREEISSGRRMVGESIPLCDELNQQARASA